MGLVDQREEKEFADENESLVLVAVLSCCNCWVQRLCESV